MRYSAYSTLSLAQTKDMILDCTCVSLFLCFGLLTRIPKCSLKYGYATDAFLYSSVAVLRYSSSSPSFYTGQT